jgi:hypothetical protein
MTEAGVPKIDSGGEGERAAGGGGWRNRVQLAEAVTAVE